jgi:hypothetical protein
MDDATSYMTLRIHGESFLYLMVSAEDVEWLSKGLIGVAVVAAVVRIAQMQRQQQRQQRRPQQPYLYPSDY